MPRRMKERAISLNIVSNYPTESRWLQAVSLLSLALLCAGVFSPVITLKKLVVFENTYSVFEGSLQLLRDGQLLLFLLITGFSIVLPVLKIVVLMMILRHRQDHHARFRRYLHWMHVYGKWSMLDVFVVAVMVVAVKLGMIASVEMRYGLYFFAASVLLTMLVTARVVYLTNDQHLP